MSFSRRETTRILMILSMAMLGIFFAHYLVHAEGSGSLYLSPSSATHSIGDTFSVSVRVNTGGTAINATEGSLIFDPDKLQVTSLSKSSSIFTLWTTEPTYSNSDGTIAFGGGLPNPGYSGSSGQIISVNFRAKSGGSSDIVFISGAILANDGSGTNILSSLGKATYSIGGNTPPSSPAASSEEKSTSQNVTLAAPVIRSTTHADQNKWYANSNPTFIWDLAPQASQVLLVLSAHAGTTPRVSYSPPIVEKTLPDVADGIWYLNARFQSPQGASSISSFRFNIDTHPPLPFSVTRTDSPDATNPQPQIIFSTSDILSGIDQYQVQVDQGLWLVVAPASAGHAYALPKQIPGSHTVTVKALDKAGNSASATLALTIDPIMPPTLVDVPGQASSDVAFAVHGHGTAGTHILLYAVPSGVDIPALTTFDDATGRIGQGIVDEHGDWTIQAQPLNAGSYILYAYAQDDRGALSHHSNTVPLKISFQIGNAVLHLVERIALALAGIGNWLILAVLALVLSILSVRAYRSRDTADSVPQKKGEKGMALKLRVLLDDIEDEVILLDKMSRHRPLYPEERYLRSKLVQYRKTIKSLSTDTHKKLAKRK